MMRPRRSNISIRISAVRPALARERVARAIARRFAAASAAPRTEAGAPTELAGIEQLDLDQRVRLIGEW